MDRKRSPKGNSDKELAPQHLMELLELRQFHLDNIEQYNKLLEANLDMECMHEEYQEQHLKEVSLLITLRANSKKKLRAIELELELSGDS